VRKALIAILFTTSFSGCQRQISVSGGYTINLKNGFYWLQIIGTSNQFRGQLETFILQEDPDNCHEIWRPHPSGLGNQITKLCGWKVQRSNVPILGSTDHESITLASVAPGIISLSGTFSRNTLTLTGWQPSPMVLTRATLNYYQQQLDSLSQFAQAKTNNTFPKDLKRCVAFWSTNCIN